jgi:pyruvate, orthophosphate dikinase
MATQVVRISGESTGQPSAETVGAKAANLARMAALGLPVPPAFVLPIELCPAIVDGQATARQALCDDLADGVSFLERATGKRLGDRRQPLLLSVRSSAARSMPGMLETVLDVGCTSAAVHGLVRMTGNPRFAWDCRCRFLESFVAVVFGVHPASLERRRRQLIVDEGVENDHALDSEALERLAKSYHEMIDDEDSVVLENPMQQLIAAAEAVYRSWTSNRARTYRKIEHLEDLRGTAVTIQAMVFGNRGLSSAGGVAFSRDPSTGLAKPVIDILFESQGEDVVSGTRNPETEEAMALSAPAVTTQLREILKRLEQEFADVQDVEFTVEEGKLWILQTRPAKRTPKAALRFAVDFVAEGLITPVEAVRRLSGVDLDGLVEKRLVDVHQAVACGIGAAVGVAVGRAAFDAKTAERLAANGEPVIFVRPDTSTADVAGFALSEGIVTAIGGRTAHAALVAREMGKPCIVGCTALSVDAASHKARLAEIAINEADWLSIDGGSGAIYLGRGKIVAERPEAELAKIKRWQDQSLASAVGSKFGRRATPVETLHPDQA